MYLNATHILLQNSLTPFGKEKYLNVCRWFNNIQQDSVYRQANKLIDFGTIHLASRVPARN